MINTLLTDYFDKSFITSLLCELSCNYYGYIYNCIMFPTILSSSVLTILNSSSIDSDTIKYINIILNGVNTVILAVNNNLKFNDRAIEFRDKKIKFTLLNHRIESIINKQKMNHSLAVDIDGIINDFDNLYNDISYPFPLHIKNKIIQKYGGKKQLPNSLQLECSQSPNRKASVPILNRSISKLGTSSIDVVVVNNPIPVEPKAVS